MRRRLAAVAASILLVVLAGCSGTDRVADGTSTQTLMVNGVERSYLITRPAGAQDNAPLVIMLHGGFGSAEQAQKAYGWSELAAEKGFVVAFPDGLGRAWNVGDGCCGASGTQGVDDVGFITALLTSIERKVSIDPARVYVTGMSNGAMMAYRLACDTELFAAIAPVAGTILGDCPSASPISVLEIHGDADASVRMDGEPGSGAERIDGMPVAEVNQFWRDVDGCEAPELTKSDVSYSTAECGSRTVELIVVAGAGHQWPGSAITRVQQLAGADQPSAALNATETIWEFFSAHSKP